MKKLFILTLSFGLLLACNPKAKKSNDNISQKKTTPVQEFSSDTVLAHYLLTNLKSRNIKALSPFVKTDILFSPYAHIDTTTAQKLSLDHLENPTKKQLYWGTYDAVGDSILLSIPEYMQKFVFNFNFNASQVEVNHYKDKPKSYGNSLQNAQEIFPNASFIQYYAPGSDEYGGMDWNSLILVIEENDGKPVLKAILHDQWTS